LSEAPPRRHPGMSAGIGSQGSMKRTFIPRANDLQIQPTSHPWPQRWSVSVRITLLPSAAGGL
jgi:hypothetical protein